jgi:hypothetical protein
MSDEKKRVSASTQDEKRLSRDRLIIKFTNWQEYFLKAQKREGWEFWPQITPDERAEIKRYTEEYDSEKLKHLEKYPDDKKQTDEQEVRVFKRLNGASVEFKPRPVPAPATAAAPPAAAPPAAAPPAAAPPAAAPPAAAPPATEEKLLYPEPVKVSREITDDIWAESVAETLKATAQLFPDRASASDHPDGSQERPSDEGNAANWKLLAQRMKERITEMRGGDEPPPDPDNPVDTETGAPITGNAASPEEVSPTGQINTGEINTGELTPSASDSGATESETGFPDISATGSAMPYVPRKIQITATFDGPGSELSGASTFEAQVTLKQIDGGWQLFKDPGDGTNLKIQLKNQVNGEPLLLPLPLPKGEYILSVRENESSPNDVELPLFVRIGS